jgi:hypothetical protein
MRNWGWDGWLKVVVIAAIGAAAVFYAVQYFGS